MTTAFIRNVLVCCCFCAVARHVLVELVSEVLVLSGSSAASSCDVKATTPATPPPPSPPPRPPLSSPSSSSLNKSPPLLSPSSFCGRASGSASPLATRRIFSARGSRLKAISLRVAADRFSAGSAYRSRTGGSPRKLLAPPFTMPACCRSLLVMSVVIPVYSLPLLVSTTYTCHPEPAAAANEAAATLYIVAPRSYE